MEAFLAWFNGGEDMDPVLKPPSPIYGSSPSTPSKTKMDASLELWLI